ncbi:MAG TPA: DEAD/DEAH box helicase family protein, partial [Phototrophicaceae bacterium]|nr:DEAD/DEAH box helicase family protein [Phototrophicaceae bacterium]
MPPFQVVSEFQPTGDQPKAIEGLVEGIQKGLKHQVLLGATGTGKTFAVAKVVEEVQKPTLILAHNKTLAAQLYSEFKDFFPRNAVEYFVSYYDYYQPEAYVPKQDLYIEKETQINEQIDRLRISAMASLSSRRDTLIVASVSCIYGIGDPEAWRQSTVSVEVGRHMRRDTILRQLVHIQYSRNDMDLKRGTFRARGDTLEVIPAYSETAYRIQLFGDEVERITEFDPLTGEILADPQAITIWPAEQYITSDEKLRQAMHDIEVELDERLTEFKREGRLLEAQRLEQRARYDLEMIREVGYCSGIENYSRHLDQRPAGSPPWTLIDYFPVDYL